MLRWAAAQPALTGVVILGLGAVYAFFGFRMFRPLLGLTCFGLGWLVGMTGATAAGLPAGWLGLLGAITLGGVSVRWPKPALSLASAATWGILAYYLAGQCGLPSPGPLTSAGVAGALGVLFVCLNYRTMTVIVMTLQGVILLLVGFVAISTRVLPELGNTFRLWANSETFVVPVFLIMLFAAAYSYQAMHQQGDIRTGK